jgi:hypothetical protein
MSSFPIGKYGVFFAAFIQTLKERIIDRSDVHKTANAALRALLAEHCDNGWIQEGCVNRV